MSTLRNWKCLWVLILHPQAWAEDLEEFVEAVETYRKQHRLGGHFSIWICTYANYRACCAASHNLSLMRVCTEPRKSLAIEDVGPTIAEQLEVDPFTKVAG